MKLRIEPQQSPLTNSLTMLHTYCLFRRETQFSEEEHRRLRIWAQLRQVFTIADMIKDGQWIPEADFACRIRSARHIDRPIFQEFHDFVTSFTGSTEEPLEELVGWEWTGVQSLTTDCTLPNHGWKELAVVTGIDQSHLNRCWNCRFTQQE